MAGPHHFEDPVGSVVSSQGAQPLLLDWVSFRSDAGLNSRLGR